MKDDNPILTAVLPTYAAIMEREITLPTAGEMLADLAAYRYAPPPDDGPLSSALNKDRSGRHGSEIA